MPPGWEFERAAGIVVWTGDPTPSDRSSSLGIAGGRRTRPFMEQPRGTPHRQSTNDFAAGTALSRSSISRLTINAGSIIDLPGRGRASSNEISRAGEGQPVLGARVKCMGER
jgi:hypothetical protein